MNPTQEKEIFETPEVEICLFDAQDVLTVSGGKDENEGPFVPADLD